MGHLCDIMTIMSRFLVILTINRKLQVNDCSIYAGKETYNINYLLPTLPSWIYSTQAYQFYLYQRQGWVIVKYNLRHIKRPVWPDVVRNH
jgi:hypothetical protein